MGRVLATDVARQVGSPTPYVRKKAALALIRILKRSPELSGVYVDGALGLLKDRSHGVLISATQLVATVLMLHSAMNETMYLVVPALVKLLRNLLNLGYSLALRLSKNFWRPDKTIISRPDHDIAGIADPFLQVIVIRTLYLHSQHR